jgi:hypothetical protein
MLLVKFDRDWADEFSVYGFAIMDQTQFDELKKECECTSFGFGTNEGWEDEDISDGFTAQEISETEAGLVQDLFKMRPYGLYPTWGTFPDLETIKEEKEWEAQDRIENPQDYE